MDLGNFANLASNLGDLGELQKLVSDKDKLIELLNEFNTQNPDITKKIIETINISSIDDLKSLDVIEIGKRFAANKEATQPFVDFAKSKLA